MRSSILPWVQQTTDLLLKLPEIVRGFERKSPQALSEFLRWIDSAEALMSANRMAEAARLAGYKARILSPAYDDGVRSGARKRQEAAAIGLVYDAQSAVQTALEPAASKLRQARETARSLLQIIAQSGAVRYDPKIGFDTLIAQIWSLCVAHEQLKPHAAQLKTLLSSDDIKLVLAGEIDLADFDGSGASYAK